MNFKSNRLTYREFEEEDFPLFYSVFSDKQVMKYTLMDHVQTKEELVPYFDKVLENNKTIKNRRAYEFAVYLTSDNSFIGMADIEITYFNSVALHGEIGYLIKPDFWGNGYATEVAKALVDFCFTQIRLHRVVASCNAQNPQSERVMKKVGMIKEGEFREARFKNGHWHNELKYSILLSEWDK